jgi:hypothetical protein
MREIMTAHTPAPRQASTVILDKLIDELAKGKAMEKILRAAESG